MNKEKIIKKLENHFNKWGIDNWCQTADYILAEQVFDFLEQKRHEALEESNFGVDIEKVVLDRINKGKEDEDEDEEDEEDEEDGDENSNDVDDNDNDSPPEKTFLEALNETSEIILKSFKDIGLVKEETK
jgi:uncharacterized protein (UPF0305 family)